MKTILISFIIGLLFITSSAYSNEQKITVDFKNSPPEYTASEELDKKLISQTVSVIMFDKGMGTCSGTIIKEDERNHYVLTAKHCIDVTEEMYVEHNKVLYAIVSTTDDLALIVVDGKIPYKTVAKMSLWRAEIGDVVHHVAYPTGIIYKASGQVTRNNKDSQFANFQAIGGCSGGGVFNENGELVSVLWGGFRNSKKEAPVKSVTESLNDIESFLEIIGHK